MCVCVCVFCLENFLFIILFLLIILLLLWCHFKIEIKMTHEGVDLCLKFHNPLTKFNCKHFPHKNCTPYAHNFINCFPFILKSQTFHNVHSCCCCCSSSFSPLSSVQLSPTNRLISLGISKIRRALLSFAETII